MKRYVFPIILVLVSALPLAARTFTSADGTKTMEAKLISYNAAQGTVVIKLDGSHTHTNATADSFSKADQEYFVEHLKELEKHSAIQVDTDKESDSFKEASGQYTYGKKKEHFKVSLTNNGTYAFEDITAKYDIYFYKYDKAGKRSTQVVSGEESFKNLASNAKVEFETDPVEITTGCSSNSSCPKCVTKAASIDRERVIGIRVSVSSGEETLTQYYSANSVRSVGESLDKRD